VEWLNTGENRLEIENRDGSWLLYDGLSLAIETDPGRIERMFTGFRVHPGYALLRSPDGPLQSAAGYANNEGAACSATVTVKAPGGRAYEYPVSLTSGPCRFEIRFPAVEETATVSFRLDAAGREPAECTAEVGVVKPVTLHLAMMSHFDNGYTHRQSEAVDKQLRGLDTVVEQCERTREFPGGSQYRWNVACFYIAERYLETRSEEQVERFLECIRRGEIEITGIFADMLTGLSHHEELARYCLAAKTFGAEHGVPVLSTMITDAPGYTWRFAQMLADSRVGYLSVGANLTRARGLYEGQRWPFWWEAPDGSRVLVYPHGGYAEGRQLGMGGEPVDALERIHGWVASRPAGRKDVLVRCAMLAERADNARPSEEISDWVREWNETYEQPRIVLTTATNFFQRFEKDYGDDLPVERGDWTGYWEDGAASSARETAFCREAQADLFDAEGLWTALEILGAAEAPAERIEKTLEKVLLYDEHTWGAAQSISQPGAETVIDQWEVKGGYARDGREESRLLLDEALGILGSQMDVPRGDCIVVYNGLSWLRSGWVGPVEGVEGRTLVDMTTGEAVPVSPASRFFAENVPSHGYRCYRVEEASRSFEEQPAGGPSIDKEPALALWSVLGGAGRLILAETATDGVLSDPEHEFGFGDLIYEHGPRPPASFGADYLEKNPMKREVVDWDVDWDRSAPGGWREEVKHLTRSGRLADGSEVRQRFTLDGWTPDLRVRVEIDKNAIEGSRNCEAVYVAFPIAGSGEFDYDASGLLMRADRDQLSGACRDWYSVESVVRVHGKERDVLIAPVDAPLVQLGGFTGNLWKRRLDADSGLVLSYVMNNYWFTNYRASQDGHHLFEYAIRAVPKDLPNHEVLRFGWEQRHALRAKVVRVEKRGGLPAVGSFLEVSPGNVALTALKKSRAGNGCLARCLELDGKRSDVEVRFPLFHPESTWPMNLAEQRSDRTETERSGAAVEFEQGPSSWVTLGVEF
jgi:hypothetical protein